MFAQPSDSEPQDCRHEERILGRANAELTDVTADEGLGAWGSETLPRRASFARERSRLEPAMKQRFY